MRIDQTTRIYVAGCGGMLGDAVYRHFAPIADVRATDIDVNERWLGYGDVRDYGEMARQIADVRPHVIINLAAMTDLEECERDAECAWATNALGAENLGLLATKHNATYVYVSTAGVFGGENDVYTDDDTPNPLGSYAKSKYYGECYVRQSVPRHFVVRAGWMMGGGPRKDKKFVNKIYQQLAAELSHQFVLVYHSPGAAGAAVSVGVQSGSSTDRSLVLLPRSAAPAPALANSSWRPTAWPPVVGSYDRAPTPYPRRSRSPRHRRG